MAPAGGGDQDTGQATKGGIVSDDVEHAVRYAAWWTRTALDRARSDPETHAGLIGHLTAAEVQHRATELLIKETAGCVS